MKGWRVTEEMEPVLERMEREVVVVVEEEGEEERDVGAGRKVEEVGVEGEKGFVGEEETWRGFGFGVGWTTEKMVRGRIRCY